MIYTILHDTHSTWFVKFAGNAITFTWVMVNHLFSYSHLKILKKKLYTFYLFVLCDRIEKKYQKNIPFRLWSFRDGKDCTVWKVFNVSLNGTEINDQHYAIKYQDKNWYHQSYVNSNWNTDKNKTNSQHTAGCN